MRIITLFAIFSYFAFVPASFGMVVIDFEDEFPGTPGGFKGLSDMNFQTTTNAGFGGTPGYFESGYIITTGAVGNATLYDSFDISNLEILNHRGGPMEDFVLMGASHEIVISRPDGAAFDFQSAYAGPINGVSLNLQLTFTATPFGGGANIVDTATVLGQNPSDFFPSNGTIANITSLTIQADQLLGIDEIAVNLNVVPEPGSLAVLGLFASTTLLRRRRKA